MVTTYIGKNSHNVHHYTVYHVIYMVTPVILAAIIVIINTLFYSFNIYLLEPNIVSITDIKHSKIYGYLSTLHYKHSVFTMASIPHQF